MCRIDLVSHGLGVETSKSRNHSKLLPSVAKAAARTDDADHVKSADCLCLPFVRWCRVVRRVGIECSARVTFTVHGDEPFETRAFQIWWPLENPEIFAGHTIRLTF